MALFAWDVDIGQELHFDFLYSISLAFLASSSFHVEGESSRCVSSHFRVVGHGEDLPDRIEHSSIGCWIRPRCSSDWRLVDDDHLVDVLQSHNILVFPRPFGFEAEFLADCAIEDPVDKVDFPDPRHCDAGKGSSGC